LREKVIGAKIFSDMIHGGRNFEPVLDDDDNYEEEYTDEDNEDVEEEKDAKLIDVDTGTGGTRGPKWKSLEDECLIDAWKAVRFSQSSAPTKTLESTTSASTINSTRGRTSVTMPPVEHHQKGVQKIPWILHEVYNPA
jgi:hypothetical protein